MYTPAEHLDNYIEFSRLEKLTSGPGPHRKVAERLALESSDPAWAIGLYGMAYTTAGMEVLLSFYPTRESHVQHADTVAHLVPRRDERVVNGFGPTRLREMLLSYQGWLDDGGLERAQSAECFDEAFKLVGGQLTHFGRFFGIKLYEALERTMGLPHFDDVRPKNGHWSRRTLQLFEPTHDPFSNKRADQDEANEIAWQVRAAAYGRGVDLSYFEVESMLCNYRQALNGEKYPGGDVDGDLGYVRQGQLLNPGLEFRTLHHRKEIVPVWARGEARDWDGKRPLGSLFRDTGRWHTDLPVWRHECSSA